MAPPKDIARSYPKRGLTADVGFRSEPTFVGDGSAEYVGTNGLQFDGDHTFVNGFSVAGWYWIDGTQSFNYAGFAGTTLAWGFPSSGTYLVFYQKATSTAHQTVGGTLTPKQWNHIAFTLSQDGLTVKAYLNGVELTITQPSVAIVLPSLTNIAEAGIASFQNASPGAGLTLPYGGQMANQIWYDGVLTQDEVRQLMRAPNYAVASTIVTPQFYFELFSGITDSTGNATTVEDRGTTTTAYGVKRPQLPRGLSLTQNAAQARVYTGRGVDFDGSADRITAAHYNPSGDYLTTTAWVNADTLRAQGLIHNGNTGRNSFLFYMGGSGGLIFYWNDTTGDAYILHQTPLKAGQWHHLAMVLDMSDPADHQATCYIDGIAATGTRTASGWSGDNTYQFGNQYDVTGWFDGKIADCRIYDVALTQAQVRELYHNPEQVLPTGVSASNLRRYYPLSDYNDTGGTGGRYFQDMGADGEPAEDLGSALMSFAQPVPCPQLGLQQSATRLYFENNASVASATLGAAPGSACTMSAWVFVEDNNFYQYIFTLGTTHAAQAWFGLAKYNTTGKLYALQNSALGALSSLEMNLNEWNHLVIMTKSTAPYVRMFFNGVEDTSIVDSGMVAYNLTNANVYMGGNPLASAPSQGFSNDCAIWDVELSDSEVAALYNSGVQGMDVSTVQSSNLKGWWKCDDLTTLKDYSGNGANATVTGTFTAASFPENASGSTIVGDFSMKRKGVSILNLTGPDDGTAIISAQEAVYPKAGAANGYTIGFCYRKIKDGTAMVWGNDGASLNNQFMCFQQTGPNLRFNLGDGSSRPSVNTSNITDSDWHHYTLTISYATTPAEVKIYVDGAVDHSSTQSITGPPTDIREMRLGEGLFDSQSPVGCFKFYQVALSSDEVKRLAFSDLRLIKGLDNE